MELGKRIFGRQNSSPAQVQPFSKKELVKKLHHECYEIINEAIKFDEQTLSIDEKDKAIVLYKKGLQKLDTALAIKFKPNDLDEKSRTLIDKMKTNRAKVFERLDDLRKKKINSKMANSSNQSNQIISPQRNSKISNNSTVTVLSASNSKNRQIANDLDAKSNETNHKNIITESLANLKNIDRKLLDMIIENVYTPNNCSNSNMITFDSISGLNSAKQALREIVIWPMLNPDLFTGLRQPSRGVLFFGPPGCGKTLLAKAIANECKANFLSITASSLTSKWVGESEKLVKALFSVARHLKPCILFIDEIDSLLNERKDSETESTRRLKTEFFIELDGMRSDENDKVFVFAATNTPFSLDEAALRRFPKRIFINLPDKNGRKELLNKLLSQHATLMTPEELDKLAELTEGYSASDVHALCKDAALQPLREIASDKIKNLKPKNLRKIKFNDFEGSLKRIRKSCLDSSVKKLIEWSSLYGDNTEI